MKIKEDNENRQERISKLIDICGGNIKMAKKFGIPVRTIENWKSGKSIPVEWTLRLLEYAVDHDLDFSDS